MPARPDSTLADDLVAALARHTRALDIALHTVQVSVRGKTVAHAVSDPFDLDTPQRMYSVSKTITGLAIGLLADEGALNLDDPVTKHFPGMGPVHPWLGATTLRHMLAMRGPHQATTYKRTAGGWLESYFRVPPTHPPGTVFTYDTSASYVLAALVERLSGTSLVEYLRPRLLDPLGISPGLRFLTGPEGIAHGGSGLICTPRDLLRLAQLLLDGGVHKGGGLHDGGVSDGAVPDGGVPDGGVPDGGVPNSVRLLPADYLRAATSPQADTALQTSAAVLRGGYGYQLWLPRPGWWLMFGLGGQLVYGNPARGLAVVVTADFQACPSGDRFLDDALDLLVDPLVERLDAAAGHRPCTARGLSSTDLSSTDLSSTDDAAVRLPWPAPRHVAAHTRPVDGRYVKVLDGPGPAEVVLSLDDDGGRLHAGGWTTTGSQDSTSDWDVELRFDRPVRTVIADQPAVVTAGWTGVDTLDVRCALLGDNLTTWRTRLAWAPDGTLAVQSQVFGETADHAWNSHSTHTLTGSSAELTRVQQAPAEP